MCPDFTTNEAWKPIPGYEGYYEASDQGRIRSLPRIDPLGRPWPGQVCNPTIASTGHQTVSLHREGQRRRCLVHRLIVAAFYGPIPSKTYVHHRNQDGADNRLVNLECVTPAKHNNVYHPIKRIRGEQCTWAKLTEKDVRQIRRMYASGKYAQHELGRQFGVHQMQISRVVRRKTWKHVK